MRPDGSSQQAEVEATTIPPTNDLESAVVQTLPPGNYAAIVRGKNNTTGVGLVEGYNLSQQIFQSDVRFGGPPAHVEVKTRKRALTK
jgi:hypothetical protein